MEEELQIQSNNSMGKESQGQSKIPNEEISRFKGIISKFIQHRNFGFIKRYLLNVVRKKTARSKLVNRNRQESKDGKIDSL